MTFLKSLLQHSHVRDSQYDAFLLTVTSVIFARPSIVFIDRRATYFKRSVVLSFPPLLYPPLRYPNHQFEIERLGVTRVTRNAATFAAEIGAVANQFTAFPQKRKND